MLCVPSVIFLMYKEAAGRSLWNTSAYSTHRCGAPNMFFFGPYEVEFRILITVNDFVSVDQVLFGPSDP